MAEKKACKQTQMVGEGVGFERIRRITGYLVGTLDRFNTAKKAEVNDRVKHSIASGDMEQL
ncbi:MAG: anaerobic ribonucleoside-triphosphate reductase [Oscillospiraceae bacterium]